MSRECRRNLISDAWASQLEEGDPDTLTFRTADLEKHIQHAMDVGAAIEQRRWLTVAVVYFGTPILVWILSLAIMIIGGAPVNPEDGGWAVIRAINIDAGAIASAPFRILDNLVTLAGFALIGFGCYCFWITWWESARTRFKKR